MAKRTKETIQSEYQQLCAAAGELTLQYHANLGNLVGKYKELNQAFQVLSEAEAEAKAAPPTTPVEEEKTNVVEIPQASAASSK